MAYIAIKVISFASLAASIYYLIVAAGAFEGLNTQSVLYVAMLISIFRPLSSICALAFVYLKEKTLQSAVLLSLVNFLVLATSGVIVACLIYYGIHCNESGAKYNPCNDPLFCCVFHGDASSGCLNGPCPPSYPSAQDDLSPDKTYISFIIATAVAMFVDVGLAAIVFVSIDDADGAEKNKRE